MRTSPLYDTMHQQLVRGLPDALDSQRDTLALITVGISQSMSAQIGKIARAMPLDTTQQAKEQRIRRLLDNYRITQATHYHPLVQGALTGLKGQRVNILIDRVLLRDTHNVLVVSVGFRRRSLPLAWVLLGHRGSSAAADQIAVLTLALALLPPGVRVTVHGDSEFRSQALFAWLRTRGAHAMLGVPGRMLLALTPTGPSRSVAEYLVDRETVAYLTDVYVTEDGSGPVQVIAWWDRDADGKLLVRAVMTDLPATWATVCWGKRRMWIETVFRDWQSGGFHLDETGIEEGERVERLLIPLAIVYLWLVALGRWLVKRGYRELIDDGPPRSWKYSLFQLGVAWKERLSSYLEAIPIVPILYR